MPEERLPDPADIMVICSSLISCNAVDEDDFDSSEDGIGEDDIGEDDSSEDGNKDRRPIQIQLAHFSVKEYLLSDRCSVRSDFQAETCHMAIAEGCLHYLLHISEKAPLTHKILNQYPLARYAAEYWWQHAHNIDITRGRTLFGLASSLSTNDAGFLTWMQLSDPENDHDDLDLSRTLNDLALPLYYVAFVGLSEVVESIVRQNTDINAQGGFYGNALQAASVEGHEKVVQMLLDRGAEVNAQSGWYVNAFVTRLRPRAKDTCI